MTIIRESFSVGPLACNCTIIGDSISLEGMIIDPGGDAEKIMQCVRLHQLNIIAIICTHGHFDHFLAAGILHDITKAPIYLHPHDLFLWNALEMQCQMFNITYQPVPEPHEWLQDEQQLPCCHGITLHTPGHSPGSVSFWFKKHKILIAGDTLFRGSIGRTDLPGGNQKTIIQSIKERLYTLDDETLVITGHGEFTTLIEEKTYNTFIKI